MRKLIAFRPRILFLSAGSCLLLGACHPHASSRCLVQAAPSTRPATMAALLRFAGAANAESAFTLPFTLTVTDSCTREQTIYTGTLRAIRSPSHPRAFMTLEENDRATHRRTSRRYVLNANEFTLIDDTQHSVLQTHMDCRQATTRMKEFPLVLLLLSPTADDVLRAFDVDVLAAKPTDPPNSSRLRLIPREGEHELSYARIDVMFAEATGAPLRITATPLNGAATLAFSAGAVSAISPPESEFTVDIPKGYELMKD